LAKRQALPRGPLAAFDGVWLGCLALQGFAYGLADLHRDGDIMDSARAYPFFQRVRFRTLAARLGVEAAPRPALRVAADTARLAYPRRPVTFEAVAKRSEEHTSELQSREN